MGSDQVSLEAAGDVEDMLRVVIDVGLERGQ